MKVISTSVLFLVFLSVTGYAQLIDEQFRPLITTTAEISAFAVQSDGKVIAGGDIVLAGETAVNHLVRLNTDGSLDESFAPPDIFGEPAEIFTILIDHAGKILVGGNFGNGRDAFRLHADGSIDESFAVTSNIVSVFKIDSYGEDQYILLSLSYPGFLAIVNNNGSIDPSFNAGSRPDNFGANSTDFTVLSDGGVIFAGSFSQFNEANHNRVVRLKPDGSIDNTFSIGAGPQGSTTLINSVKIQPDGKILLAGVFESFNDFNAVNIVRLHPDGAVDESFIMPGPSANFFSSGIGAITLVDDNIYLAGLTENFGGGPKFGVQKLNSDGSSVGDFNAPFSDLAVKDMIHAPLLVDGPDGLFLSANFSRMGANNRSGLALLDRTTGELDADFDPLLGAAPEIRAVRQDADGNLIIGGRFDFVNGVRTQNLAKLHADGSLDEAFTANIGAGPDQMINCIELDGQGRIIVAGGMRSFDNTYTGNLVRMNMDGILDDTFAGDVSSMWLGVGVNELHVLPDGKLIVGGFFDQVNGQPTRALARLKSDGTTDTTFDPPLFNDRQAINAMAIINGDNILISGLGDIALGGFLYQIDAEGSIVNDFHEVDLSNQSILAFEPLPSGGFLAAGSLGQLHSILEPNALFQFDSEGSLIDKVSVAVYEGDIRDIMFMPDDYVLLAGGFKKVNVAPSSGLSAIKLNGRRAYHFDVDGYTTEVYKPESGGSSLIVCGRFSSLNEIPVFGIAKIHVEFPLIVNVHEPESTALSVYPNPTNGALHVDHGFKSPVRIILQDLTGKTLRDQSHEGAVVTIDLLGVPPGLYVVRVQGKNGSRSMKVQRH